MDNLLINYIKENIKNKNVIFVFPTEVAAKGWADWTLKNSALTGVRSVSMNRFIAWDDFKGQHIRASSDELQSIQSLMRKVFASHIIQKNAECAAKGTPLFTSLITPKYADNAGSFSDWIAKILPSLQLWHDFHESAEYKEAAAEKKIEANDAEDADYDTLYREYAAFLQNRKKFDPAWVKPPFEPNGDERYCIVYPEILQDWAQYKTLLSSAPEIDLLSVEKCASDVPYESILFESSVQEIREAALFLREKHNDGIPWTQMTVSVSDMENYGPYVDSVFSLYEIPHTMRSSQMLSAHLAGNLFEQIQNCASENFSYKSVRALLLNDAIPWKNQGLLNALIAFGRKNNCLCSFKKMADGKEIAVDVWEEAFEKPVHLRQVDVEDEKNAEKTLRLKQLYEDLKKSVNQLVHARTFKAVLEHYKKFKSLFIDDAKFDEMPKSDKIISRCISELYNLIELQNEYKINENGGDIRISNCFAFFVKHLATVQYLEQLGEKAVQVYPYRTSAAAPYKIHVVLGATQDLISVGTMFKQLSFLSDEKRKLILEITPHEKSSIEKLNEIDPTEHFIHLYQINSENGALFLSSHHSPSGFGFPHGALKTKIASQKEKIELRYDPIAAEKAWLLSKEFPEKESEKTAQFVFQKAEKQENAFPKKMLQSQKNAFLAWHKTHCENGEKSLVKSARLVPKMDSLAIRTAIDTAFKDTRTGKYKISATSISEFYKCPRRWLFKKVLKLKPLDNEAEIISNFLLGNIKHAILQEYCSALKEKNLPLSAKNEFSLSDEYKAILKESSQRAFERFLNDAKDLKNEWDKTLSFMTKSVVEVQKEIIESVLEKSIASLSFDKRIAGSFVLDTEKKCAEYAPDGEDYVLSGTIDCVLRNGDDIILLDYKSGSVPQKLFLDENKTDEEPDFQIPYYTELYERETGEHVAAAYFYSIRDKKLTEVFNKTELTEAQKCATLQELLAENGSDDKNSLIGNAVCFERTRAHCFEKTHDFCEAMKSMDFGIAKKAEEMCVSSDSFGNGCLDYVAICRMFFTVSGENAENQTEKEMENAD